ncbi:glycosyltransferase family protein [Dyella sp. A6]|uniref:glycosyltransferase family protein n=1 Tax=Dyella aluminiiresistens TaxID=3069105 RepID=UPI002E796AD9|nr:glycosyltransferase family protein [Dyella sp. A6]
MRILYGVQTTGRGHLVRARALIAALKARGHEVHTLFSGPPVETVWLDAVFEPWTVREGLTHISIDGRVSYLATARRLRLLQLVRDVQRFDAGGFDLVISDYEPISARIARRVGLPSIGVGHLYAYAHRVPMAGHNLLNHAVMRRFAPVDMPLGLHWHHFGQPILPPMILPDVPAPADVTEDGPVLVYLGFESLDAVTALLGGLRDTRFRIYTRVDAPRQLGNLELMPIDRTRFLADLVRARGVICNTGFSLVSEALHLGKRILTKPVRHQTEQESNAESLEQLGLATVCRTLDARTITTWLDSPVPVPMHYPDVMHAVLAWIDERQDRPLQALADMLWSQVGGIRPDLLRPSALSASPLACAQTGP